MNNNIKLIMLDLVGVLVFERDDVLNDKEDKIERLFGPNLSDEEYLNNKINKKRQEQLVNIVDYASTQSSERERAADLAERDVKDYYKAVYMEDKVGEEFDGVVSSVTSFGMFIELPNTVEGLSRLANMGDDYYIYDEMTYTIIGERTRKTYRIGDPVRIKVANVNVDLREIDFKILYKLEDRPQNEGEQQEQPFDDIEE